MNPALQISSLISHRKYMGALPPMFSCSGPPPQHTYTMRFAIRSKMYFLKNDRGGLHKCSPPLTSLNLHLSLKEELVPNGLYEQAFPCHDALDILLTNHSDLEFIQHYTGLKIL